MRASPHQSMLRFRCSPRPLQVRRIGHDAVREKEGHEAHRDVDEEHPAPGKVVRDEAAERRSDGGREDDRHAVDGHRHSALRRRKRIRQDGLLARAEAPTADALEHPKEDERPEGRRHPAKERGQREQADARHVKALAPDAGREPSADGQDDRVRHEVARQHPRALVLAHAQVSRDVRQRHVGDARVEHLHERRHRHDERDGPRVAARCPAGGEIARGLELGGRARRAAARLAHRTVTCGSTLIPMRRRSRPLWPASRWMRTGKRWTTFT